MAQDVNNTEETGDPMAGSDSQRQAGGNDGETKAEDKRIARIVQQVLQNLKADIPANSTASRKRQTASKPTVEENTGEKLAFQVSIQL